VSDQRIAKVHTEVLFNKVSDGGPEKKLRWPLRKIIRHAIMNVEPRTPVLAEPGLIKGSEPQLFPRMDVFLPGRSLGLKIAMKDNSEKNQRK
jgi:hypothetical protein